MKKFLLFLVLSLVFTVGTLAAGGKKNGGGSAGATLSIESWRNDDIAIWEDTIIPAFNKSYPDIKVEFNPVPPAEYNSVLTGRFEGGTAGDLITARPFDLSLANYNNGYLESLNDLPGMENFSDVAKSAWMTDDGSTVFAVPMASVIHGFMYNKDIFAELGLEVPVTEDDFYAALDAIRNDGKYTPLAIGSKDLWEAATMGYQNIGPNYWKGETGRLNLIAGTEKFTDSQYVAPFTELLRWSGYCASGYEAQTYVDSQQKFMLGEAAIFPTGSWEISVFSPKIDFEMGAFPPYLPNGSNDLYISDHTDIAMALNAASKNKDAAKTFLTWMTTEEFADLYTNSLPGFFSLSNHTITVKDPVGQEFFSWRSRAQSTIRNSYQILSRGEPNLESELWRLSAAVMNKTVTPEEAATEAQAGLDKWYTP